MSRTLQLDFTEDTGAEWSGCRQYRYRLWRTWDAARPAVNLLMLNPSTADESTLDPTCTRTRKLAARLHGGAYGSLVVTNLFGLRSTDPAGLQDVEDPVGEENDAAILSAAQEAGIVICAWGNDGVYLGRAAHVLQMLRIAGLEHKLHALAVNKTGEPAHPLYQPASREPTPFPPGRLAPQFDPDAALEALNQAALAAAEQALCAGGAAVYHDEALGGARVREWAGGRRERHERRGDHWTWQPLA